MGVPATKSNVRSEACDKLSHRAIGRKMAALSVPSYKVNRCNALGGILENPRATWQRACVKGG